jgi:hypothetical protein
MRVYRSRIWASRKLEKDAEEPVRNTDIQRCLAINDEVFQRLSSDADTNSAYFFTSHLYFNFARMVDKYTIIPVSDVEWDAFISLFA